MIGIPIQSTRGLLNIGGNLEIICSGVGIPLRLYSKLLRHNGEGFSGRQGHSSASLHLNCTLQRPSGEGCII